MPMTSSASMLCTRTFEVGSFIEHLSSYDMLRKSAYCFSSGTAKQASSILHTISMRITFDKSDHSRGRAFKSIGWSQKSWVKFKHLGVDLRKFFVNDGSNSDKSIIVWEVDIIHTKFQHPWPCQYLSNNSKGMQFSHKIVIWQIFNQAWFEGSIAQAASIRSNKVYRQIWRTVCL